MRAATAVGATGILILGAARRSRRRRHFWGAAALVGGLFEKIEGTTPCTVQKFLFAFPKVGERRAHEPD
jgi:hypothetical protein